GAGAAGPQAGRVRLARRLPARAGGELPEGAAGDHRQGEGRVAAGPDHGAGREVTTPSPAADRGMNDEQLLRYSRHILLDEMGVEAQERLLGATALVVGAGGLGSPAGLYLAAAGDGRILQADHDAV